MPNDQFTAEDARKAAEIGRKEAAKAEIETLEARIRYVSGIGLGSMYTLRTLHPETKEWLKENGYTLRTPFWDFLDAGSRIIWEPTSPDKT